jgi:hypothetical protein
MNLHIQDALLIPNKTNYKKSSTIGHFIIKLYKVEDKENILYTGTIRWIRWFNCCGNSSKSQTRITAGPCNATHLYA